MTERATNPTSIDGQNITDGCLNDFMEFARRDDWHTRFVGSDIRLLIGDLMRARETIRAQAAQEPST